MNDAPPEQLTPQENYDREEDLTCPTHGGLELRPGWVCPFCKWPEEATS